MSLLGPDLIPLPRDKPKPHRSSLAPASGSDSEGDDAVLGATEAGVSEAPPSQPRPRPPSERELFEAELAARLDALEAEEARQEQAARDPFRQAVPPGPRSLLTGAGWRWPEREAAPLDPRVLLPPADAALEGHSQWRSQAGLQGIAGFAPIPATAEERAEAAAVAGAETATAAGRASGRAAKAGPTEAGFGRSRFGEVGRR